jgi:Ca2+-binding RTX toxin-like protein
LGAVPVLGAISDTNAATDAVAEMAAAGTNTGVTMTAVDTAGAAIAVSFALVSDVTGTTEVLAGAFSIDASSGVVTVRDGALLDYETATSQTIWVRATSVAGIVVVQQVTIQILNVFEPVVIPVTLTALADSYTALTNDHYAVAGLAGADTITTLAGNDTLTGGAGNDLLSSGGGDDSFLVGTGAGSDAIDGGLGHDLIRALANNMVIGISSLAGIEEISAGGFAGVKLVGNAAANLMDLSGTTLIGITLIDGGNGIDTIYGSVSGDTISGGAGSDLVLGGDGNDVFLVSGTAAGFDSIDGGSGIDVILAQAANTAIGITSLQGVENISAGGFAGVKLLGSTGANLIDLSGTTLTGITRIEAGSGADTVIGSAGADTIDGGAGNDLLSGGAGDDSFTASGTAAGADSYDGGLGFDTIVALAANTTISVTALAGIEAISAGGFAGVTLAGTSAANMIDLSTIKLSGIALVNGLAGNDVIIGSAGGDALNGGAGKDVLTGGLGVDSFVFALATDTKVAAWDMITDFTQGIDQIDLSQMDAMSLTAGDQAFSFIGSAVFGLHAGELRVNIGTAGYVRITGDLDGNGSADFEIRLNTQAGITGALSAADFVL